MKNIFVHLENRPCLMSGIYLENIILYITGEHDFHLPPF